MKRFIYMLTLIGMILASTSFSSLAVNEVVGQDLSEVSSSDIVLDNAQNNTIEGVDGMECEILEKSDTEPNTSLYKDAETLTDEDEHDEMPSIDSKEESSKSLYVLTYSCPTEIIEYVKENISQHIRAAVKDTGRDWRESEIKVGQPFTYSEFIPDMFTFPVYAGEEIIYTFRVGYSPYNKICGTLSQFLVKELNEYLGATSISEPLQFNIEEKTLYGILNGETNELATFHFYDENAIESYSKKENAELVVENLSNYIDLDISLATTRDPARFLNLSITEVQPKGSTWCVAYTTAAILRTQLKISSSAKEIMNYYDYTEGDFLSVQAALTYARRAGLNSALYSSSPLRNSELMSELDSYSPVLMVMDVSNFPMSHAVVLRGYSVADTEWSIWDPMYSSYQYYSMLDIYQTPDGYWLDYKWDGRTIYNYHK